MTKRIIGLLLVMSIFLSCVPVFASSTDKAKPQFARNTVITESNFNDVLVSVGLDPSTCIGEKSDSVGITTVGQLQDELEKIKKLPKEINLKENTRNDTTTIGNEGATATVTPLAIITGSVTLRADFQIGDVTTITQQAKGSFSKDTTTGTKVWTAVGNPTLTLENLDNPYCRCSASLAAVCSSSLTVNFAH